MEQTEQTSAGAMDPHAITANVGDEAGRGGVARVLTVENSEGGRATAQVEHSSNGDHMTWLRILAADSSMSVEGFLEFLERCLGDADCAAKVAEAGAAADAEPLLEGTIGALHVNEDTREVGVTGIWRG